jgi:integrase
MPKITKRMVDALEAKNARYVVWDDAVTGFGVRVTPAGAKSYVLAYRVGNRKRWHTIGVHGDVSSEQARDKAEALRQAIKAEGADPAADKRKAREVMSVRQMAEAYLDERPARADGQPKKDSSWENDASNINRHIIPLLGSFQLTALTEGDIKKFQRDVAKGKTARDVKTQKRGGRAIVTGGTAASGRSLAVLKAMLSWAVSIGAIVQSPAERVKVPQSRGKERFLSGSEVAVLAETLGSMVDQGEVTPAQSAALRLLLLTGCRRNEITTLRWDYVDFERGLLLLPDSKTGKRAVPLASSALAVLSALPRCSPWVFPGYRGNGPIVGIQKVWERVRVRANLEGVRLHDLRHSHASFAVADGASLYLTGKVLGHRNARTTERYAHIADDPVRQTVERTASKIADMMARKSSGGDVREFRKPKK